MLNRYFFFPGLQTSGVIGGALVGFIAALAYSRTLQSDAVGISVSVTISILSTVNGAVVGNYAALGYGYGNYLKEKLEELEKLVLKKLETEQDAEDLETGNKPSRN